MNFVNLCLKRYLKRLEIKKVKKRIKPILNSFLFFLSLFSLNFFCQGFQCVFASGIFPEEYYCLSKNKSMIMCPSRRKHSEFIWKIKNKNVLTIDEKSVITAVNQGNCLIEAVERKTGKISKCTINVTPSECVTTAYVLPCQVFSKSNFSCLAVTDSDNKNICGVKFILKGHGINKEISGKKVKSVGNKDIWSAETTLNKGGEYGIQVFAVSKSNKLLGKKFETKVMVNSKDISNESLSIPRCASENAVKFIASCESFSSNLISDYKNKLSIGYGHIVNPFTGFYKNLSPEEGLSLLINDINNSSYGKILNKFLIDNNVYFTQQQFDALLSFTYNLGIGWMTNGSDLKDLILNIDSNKNNTTLLGKVTSTDGINLRCGSSVNSKKITALRYGETIEILNPNKYNGSWYFVKTSSGKTGYCYCDYVKIFTKSTAKKDLKRINKDMFIKLYCAYHHAGGKCNTGLLSRRFHELDIFFNKNYSKFYYLYYKKRPYRLPECMR